VKRTGVILLLLAYCFSTTQLGQLLKLPLLVSHVTEHKHNDANMTVWDYLVHHYGGHEQDDDWETDMKLPFMQQDEVLNILVTPPNEPVFQLTTTLRPTSDKLVVFYKDKYIPSSYLESIWQPPRI
jgi:hypothetical protein